MKRLRILNFIMKKTHMYPIIFGFLLFVLVDAFIILLAEPSITTYGDALWCCYGVMEPELSKEELVEMSERAKMFIDKVE